MVRPGGPPCGVCRMVWRRERKSAEASFFEALSGSSGLGDEAAAKGHSFTEQLRSQGNERFAAEVGESGDEVAPESETQSAQPRTLPEVIAAERIDRINLLRIHVEEGGLEVLQELGTEDWLKIHQLVIQADQRENSGLRGHPPRAPGLRGSGGGRLIAQRVWTLLRVRHSAIGWVPPGEAASLRCPPAFPVFRRPTDPRRPRHYARI